MKSIFTFFLMLMTSSSFAQESQLQWLDLMLSKYQYPHAVAYFTVNTQQQKFKMVYMDINRINNNGHSIVLLHGKTLMVPIGKQPSTL